MKLARKEISIFSVSTLDLFASALGAFMIVALMLLPYFPNTDPTPGVAISPDELEAVRNQLANAEAALEDARLRQEELARDLDEAMAAIRADSRAEISPRELERLRDELSRATAALDDARLREQQLALALEEATSRVPRLPPIDLVIALDTTASMENEVAGLREDIAGLAELLVRLTDDAAIGIIDFKDRCDPQTALRVAPLQPIDRRSVRRLTAFARSMRPGSSSCNNTPEEDYAEALQAAVTTNWRSESEQRVIVMISDNAAHPGMTDWAVQDARDFARRPGARHRVSSVYVNTGSLAGGQAFMQAVAQAGQGQFVHANEHASLSVTILIAIFDS